ncbi:MAG: double zinc ribbon domain-containing protein [Candidatus Kariarchaeaceae archaeon]
MKKCRNCRTTNSSNVYRCINCGSLAFERKTTGIILFIFAIYSFVNYITIVLLPWESQVDLTGGDPSTLVFYYLLQIAFIAVSLIYSYRVWPSGFDWVMKLLGKKVPKDQKTGLKDQSAIFRSREQVKPTTPVTVHQNIHATKQCPECKAMNPDIAKFCYSCSRPFQRAQTVKETIAPPTVESEKQETTNSCPNCGVEQMASEQKFCYNCGYEINENIE